MCVSSFFLFLAITLSKGSILSSFFSLTLILILGLFLRLLFSLSIVSCLSLTLATSLNPAIVLFLRLIGLTSPLLIQNKKRPARCSYQLRSLVNLRKRRWKQSVPFSV